MDSDEAATPSLLQGMRDNAKQFGLTDLEVWQALDESLRRVGAEATVLEYLDEITAALAHQVVAKAGQSLV